MVNAALDFFLSDPHTDGPESSGQALANAQARHLGNDEQDEAENDFAAGRRHAGNPADVALLAAAEPEPIEERPPGESDDEDDNAGEEWKEGK